MRIAKYAALFVATLPLAAHGKITYITENYEVTIIEHCAEDETFCRNVTYIGKSKKTGKSVKLKGSQTIRPCADGVTPCQMMGWEFFSGPYRYAITDSHSLWVTRD